MEQGKLVLDTMKRFAVVQAFRTVNIISNKVFRHVKIPVAHRQHIGHICRSVEMEERKFSRVNSKVCQSLT
jgi:hypothetical protein